MRGSSTAANSSGSLSNGIAGIAAINLRALGAQRTLVLLDGQRSVASSTGGIVDVNTFPQVLIKQVDVVTGGASSAYGSDAVSGVVNFILDKEFKGFKADYEYGVTTYGDAPNHKISSTAGIPFAKGRGHSLLSGDSTGDLKGTYFSQITNSQASINQLTFGPTNGQWMVGGDYPITRVGHLSSNSLVPNEERSSVFGRLSDELSPAITWYGQMAYSRHEGQSFYQQTPGTGVVIKSDNAFVPAAFKATLAANKLSSFTVGTSNAGIPAAGSDNIREVSRYVIGANGGFGMSARNGPGMPITSQALPRPRKACVPTNRIGVGGVTDAALNYIFNNGNQLLRAQTLKRDVAEVNLSTDELFDTWSGPVSFAVGAGYRKESVTGYVDPIFNSGWLYGRSPAASPAFPSPLPRHGVKTARWSRWAAISTGCSACRNTRDPRG